MMKLTRRTILFCISSMLASLPTLAESPRQAQLERLRAIANEPVPYKNVREALAAIKTSTDPVAIQIAYRHFSTIPVLDHADLMALYDEAKDRENNLPVFAKDSDYENFGRVAQISSIRLSKCIEPQFQGDIAKLLEEEATAHDEAASPKSAPVTERGAVKATIRLQRIKALIDASGGGKNEKARPALWKIIESSQDGYFGQLAVQALGEIGNPADLDRLMQMLKKNPNLRFSLASFGALAIPRLLQEMNDPSLSESAKAGLSLSLVGASSHDDLPLLVSLLKHPEGVVVTAAQRAIEKNLRSDDDSLIRDLLKSPDRFTRASAIIAIGQQAWSEKYAPLLIGIVKTDPIPSNRSLAAYYLGLHKERSAIPALTEALKDPHIHADASFALKQISN